MSSIKINGAAKIADLAMLAVELEEDAGTWRVKLIIALAYAVQLIDVARACAAICDALHGSITYVRCCTFITYACQSSSCIASRYRQGARLMLPMHFLILPKEATANKLTGSPTVESHQFSAIRGSTDSTNFELSWC